VHGPGHPPPPPPLGEGRGEGGEASPRLRLLRLDRGEHRLTRGDQAKVSAEGAEGESLYQSIQNARRPEGEAPCKHPERGGPWVFANSNHVSSSVEGEVSMGRPRSAVNGNFTGRGIQARRGH